jgi:hypothetical protein
MQQTRVSEVTVGRPERPGNVRQPGWMKTLQCFSLVAGAAGRQDGA